MTMSSGNGCRSKKKGRSDGAALLVSGARPASGGERFRRELPQPVLDVADKLSEDIRAMGLEGGAVSGAGCAIPFRLDAGSIDGAETVRQRAGPRQGGVKLSVEFLHLAC